MIYLRQIFNLHPASPRTRDAFCQITEERFLPALPDRGTRLIAAWFSHAEWFSQIEHVLAFESLADFEEYRAELVGTGALAASFKELAPLAFERREELVEDLGAIPTSALESGLQDCAASPAGVFSYAILEVSPGRMADFRALLEMAGGSLPILACWTDVAGNPDRVIDLWKGDPGGAAFAPSNEMTDAFFAPLREIAPRERLVRLHPLPYSPLQ